MTADPAALRALAARVEAEEPTPGLNFEVGDAFGWKRNINDTWSISPAGEWRNGFPDFLTDLTAAASAMPEGWWVTVQQDENGFRCDMHLPPPGVECEWDEVTARAPTEPRARVAAALRARAADLEAGG